MSNSSDQWMQFCNQISMDEDHHVASSIAFSDATVAAVASESILSPRCTSCSPKGCVSKPGRRRPRASKKMPTTLLNANTDNFRALVQQFTGCPSTDFSFGSKKGPVNLNFGLANDHRRFAATSVAENFGNSSYYCDNYDQQSHQVQQQVSQEQQYLVSFDNVGNDAIFASASNYYNPNGFAMDSDAVYSENRNDPCFL